jgi:periplasmic protein TonB
MSKLFLLLLLTVTINLSTKAENINTKLPTQYSDTTEPIFTKPGVRASFPGGKDAWRKYFTGYIEEYADRLSEDMSSGTCYINFIVDTTGKITDVKAMNMKESMLAQIAIKAIKKGPKWIPATQNGKKVISYRTVPVRYKMEYLFMDSD